MRTRIIFMGTPDYAASILAKLHRDGYDIVTCVTQPDKPSGRKMKQVSSPVKVLATSLSIPVLQPVKIRTPEFLAELSALNPDLIVTAAYGRILPHSILELPAYGCLNVHGSLLPFYRGAAPVQWALLRGERESGVTVMRMDEGMDTGAVLETRAVSISEDMDAAALMLLLAREGADLLSEVLPRYIRGEIVPFPQDEALASHAPPIQKEQGLIDWNKDADTIHNQIRALTIWPGAYTFIGESRIKIYSSSVDFPSDLCSGEPETPGRIVRASGGDLIVSCAEGTFLRILSLQPESGRRMDAGECAHNFRVGDCFREI